MKVGIEMLVFDWGEVVVPPGASADFAQVKKRRDGQPDRRTKLGRSWWAWFNEQNAAQQPTGINRVTTWWKSRSSEA